MRAMTFIALVLAACAVAAQMLSPGYGTYGAPMSNFISSSYLVQQVATGTRSAASAGQAVRPVSVPPPALRFTASSPVGPRALAQSYPAAARAQVEQFFAQTLEGYHALEARFGLRRHDLAGAVATFVAGNYIAYRDEPFPDEHFAPLVRQLRSAMGDVPALRNASDADKQQMYEHMAIVGTYMALTREALQQHPNPRLAADMKRAAERYLQQFLGVDPSRIAIHAQGLTVR